MSTALERVEAALKVDVVIAGQQAAEALNTYRVEDITQDDLAGIADRGTVIASAVKKLESEQSEVLAPFRDGIARIQARFTQVLGPLKTAKDRYARLYVDAKALLARKAEDERRAAEAAAAAAAKEQAAEDSAAYGDDAPLDIPSVAVRVEAPANTARGAVGAAVGVKDVEVEMVDVTLVAKHFPSLLLLDRAAAKKLVKAEEARAKAAGAKPSVPGLAWVWTERTTFRGR